MEIKEITIKESKYDTRKRVKSRISIFPEGENLIENLQNRHCRPYNIYKKEILPELKKRLKEEHNIDLENNKIRWSQYAGCSCGCSPGFIIEGYGFGVGIYVTITE
jgi:hypothetical protein